MDPELSRIFLEAHLRLTAPRVAVFTALKESSNPLSIVQIAKLRPDIDKVSVYRTMQLFTTLKIVTPVTHGWKYLYELATPFQPHHHHMVCELCGSVIELQSPSIEEIIQKIASEHGFTPTAHHFEITGVCRDCSPKATTS